MNEGTAKWILVITIVLIVNSWLYGEAIAYSISNPWKMLCLIGDDIISLFHYLGL